MTDVALEKAEGALACWQGWYGNYQMVITMVITNSKIITNNVNLGNYGNYHGNYEFLNIFINIFDVLRIKNYSK